MSSRPRARVSWVVLVGTLVSALASPAPVRAQSEADRIVDLERKLNRALQVIEELSGRIQQLEITDGGRQPASPSGSGTPSAPVAQEPAPLQAPERGVAVSVPVEHHGALRIPGLGIPLRGFIDLGGGVTNAKGKPSGFGLGSLDFYLTPQFGDQARGLAELVFEFDDKGELTVDLERLQLGYTFRDELTAWLGRFHTPFGYWNTAYHHGRYLHTTATRPEFLEFEDKRGVLPVHTVGLWGTGGIALGNGRLTYDAFFGNSPTIDDEELNPLNIGRENLDLSAGIRIGYAFRGALEGLQVGGHWLRGDVRAEDDSFKTALMFGGGYLFYGNYDWEVLAESYWFHNQDRSGDTGSHESWAGYVQVGRSFGAWTPYGRFEVTDFDQTDNYFSQLRGGRSYRKGIVGIRYELTPRAALKLEFSHKTLTDQPRRDDNAVQFQYAVGF